MQPQQATLSQPWLPERFPDTPGMASVGSHACYTHGISIDPTFIFSTSLHGPRTPLLAAKYQVVAHFFCLEGLLFSSTCLSSALPSGAWEPPLPMQCLPRFSAFFLCAHSLSSATVSGVCRFCSFITHAFPTEKSRPKGESSCRGLTLADTSAG